MNAKKIISGALIVIIAAFLLYNSVYFMSLPEYREQQKVLNFNPVNAIEFFWADVPGKLPEKAIDLQYFDELLTKSPQELAGKHGKTLGIGAPHSLLLKGIVEIKEIQDDLVKFHLNDDIDYSIRIRSIFSNTVREASGYFELDRFETTMDFNLIALEINNRIVQEIINPVIPQLIPGALMEFVGAADINLKKLPVATVEIIPLQLKIIQP
jgi:predicted lipoprotein